MSPETSPEIAIPEPGQIFDGRFRIDGVLGEGGMGIVLRAHHELMEVPLAIKILHPALAGHGESVARFLREAQNAAAIRSEYVGQVLDVARTVEGLPYIVMELIEGADLQVVCEAKQRLLIAEATTYILHACVAVAEAHAMGIVHRDLKPANLILTTRADGTPLVKVFDFGISKRSGQRKEETTSITKTGVAVGTPSYMAPEQITDFKNVDERADVWSLGAILYEMLGGRQPFEGDTVAAVMSAVASSDPPLLSTLRGDIPEQLEAVVAACLEKEADKRLPDVAALARSLEPFLPEDQLPLVTRVERTRHPAIVGPESTTRAAPFRNAIANAATIAAPEAQSPSTPDVASVPAAEIAAGPASSEDAEETETARVSALPADPQAARVPPLPADPQAARVPPLPGAAAAVRVSAPPAQQAPRSSAVPPVSSQRRSASPPVPAVIIRKSEAPAKPRDSFLPGGDNQLAVAQRAKEAVLAQRARDAALARKLKDAAAQKEKTRVTASSDYRRRSYQLTIYIAVLLTLFVAARLLGLEPAPWLPNSGARP